MERDSLRKIEKGGLIWIFMPFYLKKSKTSPHSESLGILDMYK